MWIEKFSIDFPFHSLSHSSRLDKFHRGCSTRGDLIFLIQFLEKPIFFGFFVHFFDGILGSIGSTFDRV